MQPPMKHHFLPVFYLKQWATAAKGQITEFSKPYKDVVKPRRTHPDGTGYIYRLYAVDGLADDLACEMESAFLSPVDSRAADALRDLLDGQTLSSAKREAWSVFLSSLMCRMPEDVHLSREMLTEMARGVAPPLRRFYEASKPAGQPDIFDQLTAEFEANAAARAMKRLRQMMSHTKLIEGFDTMHWEVLTLNGSRQLLTSDRPVTYTNELGNGDSHLVLPLGPNRLFVACREKDFIRRVSSLSKDRLITEANRIVVEQADKYVFGADDKQLKFIQNRMGRNRTPQLVRRVFDLQRERLPDILTAISSVPLDARPLRSE